MVNIQYIDDCISIARFYNCSSCNDSKEAFERRLPFCATCTLEQHMNIVIVHGLHGEMNRMLYTEFFKELYKLGIITAFYERHGKWRKMDIGALIK